MVLSFTTHIAPAHPSVQYDGLIVPSFLTLLLHQPLPVTGLDPSPLFFPLPRSYMAKNQATYFCHCAKVSKTLGLGLPRTRAAVVAMTIGPTTRRVAPQTELGRRRKLSWPQQTAQGTLRMARSAASTLVVRKCSNKLSMNQDCWLAVNNRCTGGYTACGILPAALL